MKSDLPKVMHRLAGAPLLAHVLAAARQAGIGRTCRGRRRPAWTRSPPRPSRARPEDRALRPGRAARNRRCGQGRAPGPGGHSRGKCSCFTATRRCSAPRRSTAPHRASRRRRSCGHRLRGREARPAMAGCCSTRTRPARRHSRGEGRQRGGARAHALQFRHHGLPFGKTLLGLLDRIGNDNAKKEFYLTDAVALARDDRLEARMVKSESDEVLGVNSRASSARRKP